MLKTNYEIPDLPPSGLTESKAVLKALIGAHKNLAELKGSAQAIPNQSILINTLSLQEARASSEIENIVTTQDELFQISKLVDSISLDSVSPAAKEVARYREALSFGFQKMQETGGLSNNLIIGMFQILKQSQGGFRNTPGTQLKNEKTGETVYTPPQHAQEVLQHMHALERYINQQDQDADALDPLVKMAIIHHQFESIHPFPDGNGRTGRIINVLYLTLSGLLDNPILYLSRYINQYKLDYYRLLQEVRDEGNWEGWVIFMLNAVEQSARNSCEMIGRIKILMSGYKQMIRSSHPKIYSQDLLNNLFRYPYTRVDFVQEELRVSRPTATKYLDELANNGLLQKVKRGRNVYYSNQPLTEIFIETGQ